MTAVQQPSSIPVVPPALDTASNKQQIVLDADILAKKLQEHTQRIFPPVAKKAIRRFTSSEASKFLGIHEGYLRQLAAEGKAPLPEMQPNGRRTFSIEEVNAVREFLEGTKSNRRYIPHRVEGEKLQVISVINFKGGSAKTTTTAHLAQYLALRGYRVLAIDLDPQASLSTLFGNQPELDVRDNETLYGAIRFDEHRTRIENIIRSTYLPGLHFIPGNLELMEFETTAPAGRNSKIFFMQILEALESVDQHYDVVVMDCPPNLGYLTMAALCAATSLLVTVHPQMLDVLSMAQFLRMVGEVTTTLGRHRNDYDWLRYLVTRYEPSDGPQNQMVGFMRSLFGHRVLQNSMLKSTAVADSGITKQTLYEVDRTKFNKGTYDRALEALDLVNGEIEDQIRKAWGRH
jgi:chromosome partitioning protein